MPAFVHTKIASNGFRYLRNPGYAVDPAGFDTCTARILWRGTQADMVAYFSIGGTAAETGLAAPAGSTFYCIGPQGQAEEKFGHVWAEIAWKGVLKKRTQTDLITTLSTDDQVIGISRSITTREIQYPVQQGDYQILAANPAASSAERWMRPETVRAPSPDDDTSIITRWVPWRIRYVGYVFAMSVKGITIGKKKTIQNPPIIAASAPPKYGAPMLNAGSSTLGSTDWKNTPDPTITLAAGILSATGDGWLCRNYQRTSEYSLGENVLAFWTADYEWIERYGP